MKIFSEKFVSKLSESIFDLMKESIKELEEAITLNEMVDITAKVRVIPSERGAEAQTTLTFIKEKVKKQKIGIFDMKQMDLWSQPILPLRGAVNLAAAEVVKLHKEIHE